MSQQGLQEIIGQLRQFPPLAGLPLVEQRLLTEQLAEARLAIDKIAVFLEQHWREQE